jgi:hypothetical protein
MTLRLYELRLEVFVDFLRQGYRSAWMFGQCQRLAFPYSKVSRAVLERRIVRFLTAVRPSIVTAKNLSVLRAAPSTMRPHP